VEATPKDHYSSPLSLRIKNAFVLLEELAFYYSLKAFFVDMVTWSPKIGQLINPNYFIRHHKVHQGHGQLLASLFDRLKPFIVKSGQDSWVIAELPPNNIRLKIKEIQTQLLDHPDIEQESKFLTYMGAQLFSFLKDYNKGLSCLFPDPKISVTPPPNVFSATQLYASSVLMRNSKVVVMEDALLQYIQENSGEKKEIKILEIGAGTGGTTLPLLEKIAALKNNSTKISYRFTDISSFFVTRGKERLGMMFPSSNIKLEFGLLDIEDVKGNDLEEWGDNDVVLTADVFHATRYLDDTLKNTRKLLKPGGILILGEIFKSNLVLELTFGVTEGWWRFSDKQRVANQSCLLNEVEWVQALGEFGFEQGAVCRSDGTFGALFATAK
jgi:SAM-dependent methyltransferase